MAKQLSQGSLTKEDLRSIAEYTSSVSRRIDQQLDRLVREDLQKRGKQASEKKQD